MGKLFGTDGVRGIANTELTAELAYQLGRAGAYILTGGKKKAKIVIGRDTRISGDMLKSALVAGILSTGSDALCVGVVPTPAVAYLTRHYGADAGVVISASHNPVEYNGIKFFNKDGFKLPDEVEEQIEAIIHNGGFIDLHPTGGNLGKKVEIDDAIKQYSSFLKSTINVDLRGLKVAVDCANGAAYVAAPSVLSALGAEIKIIHHKPDGLNINLDCGSTHPGDVQKLVQDWGADVGLAFDGDADRLIAVDEKGQLVDGDKILTICGCSLKEKGQLPHNTIVATVMSNIGLDIALKKCGCKAEKTNVGDRYVLEKMKEEGYVLGGEQSGHIIFLQHNTTGDGLLSALQLLAVMKEKEQSLSKLAGVMTDYPQVLINAKVSNSKKNKYMEDEVIVKEITKLEELMDGEGRVLIRPSGTEPLVRVMLEGKNESQLRELALELAKLIEERLQ
ncbi:MAG: phosphoglucosamine mutase [Anaerosolibacter sp.]|jgi:phosphoglucosamine mutase|uniref:phosphoglucosamine mutase n=1 Tax=Anaerosolibacter sp. TaxID=1872527 RepID=UPI002603A351|nr:phosphoglucosamine mutase [Anaerosolibacter sp.]MDF2547406.1 phosphoglucosamine mutase [Anaerosolibacter sp.]